MFRPRLYSTLIVLWLGLSMLSVVMASLTWMRLLESVKAGVATSNFNESLDRVFQLVQGAETAQRGFTITGMDQFLEPYREAHQRLPAEFDMLMMLAENDPKLTLQVRNLRGAVELRMEQLTQVVETRRQSGFDSAREVVSARRGHATMEEIRSTVTRLRGQRANILTANGERTRQQLSRANLISLVAGFLGVGAGCFAFYLLRHSHTQQKRQQELALSKIRAEESSRHKSAFLANLSHEIRTPMNAILGFTDLLGGEIQEPRQRQFLGSIRTAADSLLQLISDVLDLSKIEAGKVELNLEPTDPRELCRVLHSLFSEHAARRGLEFTCDTGDSVPARLLLDRGRMRQILVNLVSNAVKFTTAGRIDVRLDSSTAPESGRVELAIQVRDTGVGIPPDRLDEVFKPFVQADPRRSQEQQGTGLGLAIVKRLTEIMGGTLAVDSRVGQGTTFELRFPSVEVAAVEADDPLAEGDHAPDFNRLPPSTLVIVDDNALNRELMAAVFAGTHHRLHFGCNGLEALELVSRVAPDVVLLDLLMPKLDGRATLQRLRGMPGGSALPVIAVTASSLVDHEDGLSRQFNGVVRKPFTRRALFDRLSETLKATPRAGVDRAARGGREASRGAPPASDGAVTPRAPGGWGELVSQLEEIEKREWLAVSASGAVNEVRAFGERLARLGESAACPAVSDYARALIQQARSYDVAAMEEQLRGFPELVRSVARATTV